MARSHPSHPRHCASPAPAFRPPAPASPSMPASPSVPALPGGRHAGSQVLREMRSDSGQPDMPSMPGAAVDRRPFLQELRPEARLRLGIFRACLAWVVVLARLALASPGPYNENSIMTEKDDTFVISQAYKITEIRCFLLYEKYTAQSELSLTESNGQTYGPWPCVYTTSTARDPNSPMLSISTSQTKVAPNLVLPPGTYTLLAAHENIVSLSFFDDTAAREDRYRVPANARRARPKTHGITVIASIHATPVPQPVEDNPDWTVAIGAGGLVSALAAIAIGRKLLGGGKTPPPDRYILQLSADSLEISGGSAVQLVVTACKVNAQGTPSPAPTARLLIQMPPTARGIQISPSQGQGQMRCTISAAADQAEETWMLTVRGQIAASTVESYVRLKVTPGYFVDVY